MLGLRFDSDELGAVGSDGVEAALRLEWLECNGLGGWASSTVSGAHTRRYHGLLVAATRPPVERSVLLSRLDDTVIQGAERFELHAARYPGVVAPAGHRRLRSFERGLFPTFELVAGTLELRRQVVAIRGQNTTVVTYEVRGEGSGELELRPLFAARGYHELGSAARSLERAASFEAGVLCYRAHAGVPEVAITAQGSRYLPAPDWYYRYELAEELARGFDGLEDLFTPGVLVVKVAAGDRLAIVVTAEPTDGLLDGWAMVSKERRRRLALLRRLDVADDLSRTLALAADQFLVERRFQRTPGQTHEESPPGGDDSSVARVERRLQRSVGEGDARRWVQGTTVIAGYPWFTDWGRDSMISLPGLCLSTGRHREASSVLRAFAAAVDRGLLPNRFQDDGDQPEYNTVDATLWMFVAVWRTLLATGDERFAVHEMKPVLEEVLAWHRRGTRHGIHQDGDGLLWAGEQGVQLTWMDARVGDWVVTPRRGKPVEINALWINALSILGALRARAGEAAGARELREEATRARQRFAELFWNEEEGCLFDCVDQRDGGPASIDRSIRPNQVLALALPFPVLDGGRAERALDTVGRRLLTPRGLRTLASDDAAYRPRYEGGPVERDAAYHQGTVWPWLLGPWCDAQIAVRGEAGRREAREILARFAGHLREGAVGSVSEVFDAEEPHRPGGCPAQAWSVAELLRVACRLARETGADAVSGRVFETASTSEGRS